MTWSKPETDLSHLPDEALWQAHVAGLDAAFSEVRRRYQDKLLRYLVLSLGDVHAAAQQLGRVLRAASDYREPLHGFDSLKGWLFAVATQGATPANAGHEEGFLDFLSEFRQGEPHSRQERILRALRDLRREHRQPFLLVTVAGLSLPEAAKACRFTVERTRGALARAYQQLAGSVVFAEE